MDVLDDDHVPPESPFDVMVVVLPTQTLAIPLNVPASGPEVTVIERVAKSDPVQDPDPFTV
jgi:hypothetical protein